MRVTFWGVRGSIATAGPEVARFGGNTTCLELEAAGHRLVIDAGTGIRGLGDRILAEAKERRAAPDLTILFTHLHWDHIQGFPFFGPAFRPDARLCLIGPRSTGDGAIATLEEALERQMQAPSFPVPFAALPSMRVFEELASGGARQIGPFRVQARSLCHPQGVLGYRVEAGGCSICFATDTELAGDGDTEATLRELARDVDLLICDAQYTEAEYAGQQGPSRRGWGHSTYVAAAQVAREAGAKRLALFHHDPAHDDDTIERIESDARSRFAGAFASRERSSIELSR
jgi:phosphoribosyl 1,2-cyclic phosphodiesterase